MDAWVCSACTLENLGAATCELCGHPRIQLCLIRDQKSEKEKGVHAKPARKPNNPKPEPILPTKLAKPAKSIEKLPAQIEPARLIEKLDEPTKLAEATLVEPKLAETKKIKLSRELSRNDSAEQPSQNIEWNWEGKSKADILLLIDSNVDINFQAMLGKALTESKLPFRVQQLHSPHTIQWQWRSGCNFKDVDCIMRRVSAPDFFSVFLGSSRLQDEIDLVLRERPHASFTVFVDGLHSLVQTNINEGLQNKRKGDWPWSRVEAAMTQAWFASGGKVRFTPCASLDEVCLNLVTATKKFAEAPYRAEDDLVSLARSTRTLEMRGADLSRLRRVADQGESWIKFLAQIPGVSETKAAAVVRQYPTFSSLKRRYSELSLAQLPGMLADTPTVRSQRLGPVLSRRIYRALCSRNADEDLCGEDHT